MTGAAPPNSRAWINRQRLSMGIENGRVLGTESGRVGPLSRVGSVATGAGRPPGSAGVSPAFVSAQPGPSPPTRLDRQSRRGSALDGFTPFLPTGLVGAPSQAFCAVRYGSACGRDAHPGARASRPHLSRHSLALLLQSDSTGNRARALLWTGLRRSCRRGWRVHHRRRSARYATAVHAGGTPTRERGRLARERQANW